MKKCTGFLIIVMIAQTGFSQNFYFKPLVGTNLTIHQIEENNEGNLSSKLKLGFDFGLCGEMKISDLTFIEMAWIYSISKGSLVRIFYSLVAGTADYPITDEDFTLRAFKLPINFLFKAPGKKPTFFGCGFNLKHYFQSTRMGLIEDFNDRYKGNFEIKTAKGNSTGLGAVILVGKEFNVNNRASSLRLTFDGDITKWHYPTDGKIEEKHNLDFRAYSFSLLFSVFL